MQDEFVGEIEQHVAQKGLLPAFILSRTFSYLRANDLIYWPEIKSYMMGEAPLAFDLLYWNSDATGLPGKSLQYLRYLCQQDQFSTTGITLFGEALHLSDITVLVFAIGCEIDHIAAWPDSYCGVLQTRSRSKTPVMARNGHIGGIINPPSKNKYGYYSNPDMRLSPVDWQGSTTFHSGSWWPKWEAWLRARSGKRAAAKLLGSKRFPPVCLAPGTYVRQLS